MNFHDITHDDMKNGDGLRVVLWTAGCEHHCPGCQNPCTWDCQGGLPFTDWEEAEFWTWLGKPWTQGATFSGGDPLHPVNRDKIGQMAVTIKERYADKDIWVYTGYELNFSKTLNEFYFVSREDNNKMFFLPWLNKIDVLVDGRFEMQTRENDIKDHKKVLWRGSSNQRVIEIKESLKEGRIICRKGI